MTYSDVHRVHEHIAAKGEAAIHIHAFIDLPCGSQEYTNDADKATGWCSMVRVETPEDENDPFDIILDVDHKTIDQAKERAERLAALFFDDPDDWSEY